jgi:hypothetical protein
VAQYNSILQIVFFFSLSSLGSERTSVFIQNDLMKLHQYINEVIVVNKLKDRNEAKTTSSNRRYKQYQAKERAMPP